VIAARLQRNAPYKDAVRRGLSLLALPGHAGVALRCTARTVDSMWHAAGERSVDFSWYPRRATLAAVWGAVLLVWLRDDSPDAAATLAFLDRRLADLGRIGRLRRRATGLLRRRA
jgi:ubiquinone biosynthesis protein COQ9